jgi:glycosyltransferase involved in cell wall biosynthesis
MNVLMISGDRHILEPVDPAYKRIELQREQVDRLDVFIWPQIHTLRDIFKVIRENSYDVVTVQDPFWRGLLGLYLARKIGAKLNVQIHTDLKYQSSFRRFFAKRLLPRADSIRVVSEGIKEQLIPLHLKAKISILPIYVDPASFRQIEHRSHPRFKTTIVWIGRFEAEKDPLAALNILKEVRDQGIDAGLVMLGSGSLTKELRSEAKWLALYVEFPGWQNPAPYLSMADVVLSTSKHESYGASIIEALAAGVPVVSPDVGIARSAGAIVVPRGELARSVIKVLRGGTRGVLKLPVLTASEWATRWRETLV